MPNVSRHSTRRITLYYPITLPRPLPLPTTRNSKCLNSSPCSAGPATRFFHSWSELWRAGWVDFDLACCVKDAFADVSSWGSSRGSPRRTKWHNRQGFGAAVTRLMCFEWLCCNYMLFASFPGRDRSSSASAERVVTDALTGPESSISFSLIALTQQKLTFASPDLEVRQHARMRLAFASAKARMLRF